MAIIVVPPAESTLVTVKTDDRTSLGLFLPHEGNSARIDVRRLRASLVMIDAFLAEAVDQEELAAMINAAVAGLVDAAPGALDTLNELAAALGDDPNFAATVTAALGAKADKSQLTSLAPLNSPALTGNPTAPTATQGDNDTTIATTAFVVAEILARVIKATGVDLRALTDDAKFLTAKAMADAMALVTAPATATIAPDFALGFNRLYTMGLNATLGQPTNMKDGEPVVLYFQQDSTGGRTLSFSATHHKFLGGNVPTLSTAANAIDRLAGICRNRAGTMVVEWSGIEQDIR